MADAHKTPLYKRKYPRRRFPRAVGFLLNGEHHVGEGREIGEGGMAIYLPQDFELGREAVISFQIPDGSFICLRIETRSADFDSESGHFLIGCQFQNLSFDHKREIRNYVSARTEFEH